MSWFSGIFDSVGGWFDDIGDGIGDLFGGDDSGGGIGTYEPGASDSILDSQDTTNDGGGSFWKGGLGNFITDVGKTGLGGLINSAPGFLNAAADREAKEEQMRLQREDSRYAAMIELAKLKYGMGKGGGGGGGGGGNSDLQRKQLMIETLLAGQDAKSAALTSLQKAFSEIYKGV